MTACYQLLSGAVPDLAAHTDRLRARLAQTRTPVLPPPAGGAFGVRGPLLDELIDAWPAWLAQSDETATGSHRLLHVGGRAVHCVQFTGTGGGTCLLLHGWPTSFLAFHRLVPLLRRACSEVVLASLPGFGTSPLDGEAWTVADTAALLTEAMGLLGHDRFVVHGEDWGSLVAREMGRAAPDQVRGVHVSAGLAGFMARVDDPGEGTRRTFTQDDGAYLRLQSTRPDSLAHALADSPAGLLAWQLDKFQLWQGDLPDRFGLGSDFILANATLYWITGCIGTSMRIYAANRDALDVERSETPTGVSVFGRADFASKTASARHNRLIAWYEHETGGHVAALDAPELLAADLSDFIDRTQGDPR
ncbi:alpha/beta fold hydrolase [Glycomyces arizonensis]|uniref:alpha/beta fold hydrolase n=1 Tax=Glycomyces arizonensis TaxID=256035 RepID=UPI00146F9FEB|nr:alpha/beta hydrolase [Glycomyces arizonensis]